MAHEKRRVYCWYTGNVFEEAPGGDCPECGPHGRDHREVVGDRCGCYVPADGWDSEAARLAKDWRIRGEHGYPCSLPIGHPGGRMACRYVPAEESET